MFGALQTVDRPRTVGRPRAVCQYDAVLRQLTHSRIVRLFTRFAAGSVIATVCSQLAFLLSFGIFGGSAVVSGAVAFLAGAVPNFIVHRFWTWRRRGRVGMRHELIPYLLVIGTNAAVAIGLTAGLDRLIGDSVDNHAMRTILLTAAFGASYVLLFVLKFALLDRLVFAPKASGDPAQTRRAERSRHQVPTITRA